MGAATVDASGLTGGHAVSFVGGAGALNRGDGNDTVKTSASYMLTPNVEKLIFIGAGNFTGSGNKSPIRSM